MQRTVDESLADVDAVLFVLAADEAIRRGDRFIAARVYGGSAPVVIALNKVDVLTPDRIAAAIAKGRQLGDFHALHPVSGRTGDGVEALRDELVAAPPGGPAYFPDGELTDQSVEGGSPSSSASRRST